MYRLFVLSFENDTHRTVNRKYYFPVVEIRDHNVMISGHIWSASILHMRIFKKLRLVKDMITLLVVY